LRLNEGKFMSCARVKIQGSVARLKKISFWENIKMVGAILFAQTLAE
jgi:hypothetical protein